MYLSKVSAALLYLAIGVSDVAAGPCKPESSQTLTESSMRATSSVFDAASTSTSIVSSAETTQTRPDHELSSTVSLGSSSVEVTSATTTNTESALTATEFLETTTTLPSTIKETTDSSTMMEVSESSTALPSTTEEAPSTSTAPGNEQPQTFTGFATWVDQNGAMGDCGLFSQNTEFVVALDYRKYDRSMCGQKIRVTATSGRRIGASVDVTIVDACFACRNANSLDLSMAAFTFFQPLDDPVFDVKWQYLP